MRADRFVVLSDVVIDTSNRQDICKHGNCFSDDQPRVSILMPRTHVRNLIDYTTNYNTHSLLPTLLDDCSTGLVCEVS